MNLHTGTLTPHGIDSPYHWCTCITKATPDMGPEGLLEWARFLETITRNDNHLTGFLQQVAGMALIGAVYHEGIVIAYGSGRNGKSTFGWLVEHYHGIEGIPPEHRVFAYPQLNIREQMAAYQEVIDRSALNEGKQWLATGGRTGSFWPSWPEVRGPRKGAFE